MLRQLLVGAAVSACNIGIHALVMTGRGPGRASGRRKGHVAAIAATDRRHDRDRVGPDGRACIRGNRLVAGLRDRRCRASRRRPRVFRVRELHDARLRRRNAGRALAAARADGGDERRALFGWSTAVIFEVLRRTVRVGTPAAGPSAKER
jgi:hypothetical protein